MCRFLPAPSVRRATVNHFSDFLRQMISIHALREEGDLSPATGLKRVDNFYPRPPRGGRRSMASRSFGSTLFLSTPSARRATAEQLRQPMGGMISIHALREEGDTARGGTAGIAAQFLSTPSARRATLTTPRTPPQRVYFYPRPPRGGRRFGQLCESGQRRFLSTPSARRATYYNAMDTQSQTIFLSTPSARRATPQPAEK